MQDRERGDEHVNVQPTNECGYVREKETKEFSLIIEDTLEDFFFLKNDQSDTW